MDAQQSIVDWFGVLESPDAFEAGTSLEGVVSSLDLSDFENDIDNIVALNELPFVPDWPPYFDPSFALLSSTPSLLSDDTSSSTGTAHEPQSPVSDFTFVSSPSLGSWSGQKDAALDDMESLPVDALSSPLDEFQFTFGCTPPVMFTSYTSSTDFSPSLDYHYHDGFGQPIPQDEVVPAGADVPAIDRGVDANADPLVAAFASTTPVPPVQDVVPLPEAKSMKRTRARTQDVAGKPAKRPRRKPQSTERTRACPMCDACESHSLVWLLSRRRLVRC